MQSDSPVGQKPSYKRSWKNILVNPKYQIKYTLWITSSGVLIVTIYSLLIYYYISENYSILVDLSPMTDEAKAQLYSELRQIILRISGLSVFFLAAVTWIGLIFSHRTAGPLYHFERVFRDIASGNLKARIRLRPKDDFQSVANTFNGMMDDLSKKFGDQGK